MGARLTACKPSVEDGLARLEDVHEAFHIAGFQGKRWDSKPFACGPTRW
jgi:hypothetical protein